MSTDGVLSGPGLAAAVALLEASGLPTGDLTDDHMRHFFYCGPTVAPTGLVGVEVCGSDALLRSLVVVPAYRSKGLGSVLVRHVERFARKKGASSMYLLTTTAESFFKRCGYVDADRRAAPAEIRATREFSDFCPASSAFLVKSLR
jgi:amino-acid N-acetyltransferase